MSVTRSRLRDLILRRQLGIRPADDELDLFVRLERAFDQLAAAIAPAAKPGGESLDTMLARLEDATEDARSAADDVRRVLNRLRDQISRAA